MTYGQYCAVSSGAAGRAAAGVSGTDQFDDPNLPGRMQTTITLKKVSCGTELNIVQEGVPDVIPPKACCLGWQESLALLAKLVEAEIPE